MVTIEEKLQLFSKLVYQDIANESEEKVKAMEDRNNKLILDYKQQLMKTADQIKKETDKKITQKKNEMLSKANINTKNRTLEKKQGFIRVLKNELKQMAIDFVETEQYEIYLKKNLQKVISQMNKDKKVIIQMTEKDKKRFQTMVIQQMIEQGFDEHNIDFEIVTDQMIGGFVVTDAENTFRINATMSALLEDHKNLIVNKVYEQLEKVGD
jgi:vacuolar-type H+-ATPase subunit E/Vma4